MATAAWLNVNGVTRERMNLTKEQNRLIAFAFYSGNDYGSGGIDVEDWLRQDDVIERIEEIITPKPVCGCYEGTGMLEPCDHCGHAWPMHTSYIIKGGHPDGVRSAVGMTREERHAL